jgi:hypothetical protein
MHHRSLPPRSHSGQRASWSYAPHLEALRRFARRELRIDIEEGRRLAAKHSLDQCWRWGTVGHGDVGRPVFAA